MTHNTKEKKQESVPDSLNETITRAKQELEHLIDLNPRVMLLVNADAVVIRANKALLQLLNKQNYNEVLGKRMQDIFQLKDTSFVTTLINGTARDKTAQAVVTLPQHGDHTLEFTLIGSESAPDLLSVIVEDVTIGKQHSAYMEKKHKKEAVNALAGALMHNINQPLTVIMIKAQLAQLAVDDKWPKAEDLRNELRAIVKCSAQIAELLEKAAHSKDYITEQYTPETHILDITRSAGTEDPDPSYIAVVNALIAALSAHSPESALHCRRTSEYAAFLARHTGMTHAETEVVRRCAALHDIGKLGVPATLLHKSGPLTSSEIQIIRKHVEISSNILSIFPFMEKESEAIRANHEHYDGSGYTQGLAGKDIPLYARIVAVADAYDALRHDRSYHAGTTDKDAVEKISAQAGTQFDPDIVTILQKHHEEMNNMFQ